MYKESGVTEYQASYKYFGTFKMFQLLIDSESP